MKLWRSGSHRGCARVKRAQQADNLSRLACGECRPDMVSEDEGEEEVSPELRAAILSEEVRNPKDFSYLTREECALVGIEYTGNGSAEEDDVTYLLPDEGGPDIWNEEGAEDEDDAEADRNQELFEAH